MLTELQSSEKRKTSGEKRKEIDFQTPHGGLTAVKHFARILAAPFPKGILKIHPITSLVWGLCLSSQSELPSISCW